MLTHEQIWVAIDALAARQGLSVSSLARLAGLDPTTFNRSKRKSVDGNPRWPSTESIAKILAATQVNVDDFLSFMLSGEDRDKPRMFPFRLLDGDAATDFDRTGQPRVAAWDRIPAPGAEEDASYALGICSDAYLPLYRNGDVIFVSPGAEKRAGDKVLLVNTDGTLTLGILGHETATHLHLKTFSGVDMPPLRKQVVRSLARITWASQ